MARQPRTTPRKSHRFELDMEVPHERALHEKLVELGQRGRASEWIIRACEFYRQYEESQTVGFHIPYIWDNTHFIQKKEDT